VIGYAAAAVDVAARGRAEQADVGTGATRVISVGPVGRQGLLAAVRQADPDGRFAMAAVRLPASKASPPAIAVDTTRLAAVATWTGAGPGARSTAARLHPAAAVPYPLQGDRISLDVTATDFKVNKDVSITAVLTPRGGLDRLAELGFVQPGRHTYAAPGCAGGCQLKALQIAGREGSLDVSGHLTVHTIDGAAPKSAWRSTEGGRVASAPDGLRIDVVSLNGLPNGMAVLPAGVPLPLPVATAGNTSVSGLTGLDGRTLPVDTKLRLPAVPGLGTPAVLTDLDYADRLAADAIPAASAQVWLSARAPADVLNRLRAAGLAITADTRADQVRAGLDRQGPALALWFYVIVAVLATALAAGALVLAAAVDRTRRVEDLSALRGQGLGRAAVRRATLWTYPVLVAAAVLAGMVISLLGWRLTGWALPLAGIDAPPFPLPALPRPVTMVGTALTAFAILAGVAWLAGRRTLRSVR
jgi:hypothetical protein